MSKAGKEQSRRCPIDGEELVHAKGALGENEPWVCMKCGYDEPAGPSRESRYAGGTSIVGFLYIQASHSEFQFLDEVLEEYQRMKLAPAVSPNPINFDKVKLAHDFRQRIYKALHPVISLTEEIEK
jgi:hypothetical protein